MDNAASNTRTIPSSLSAALEVQQQLLDEVQARGFRQECLFAIRLALDEALANAVRHGNDNDPDKQLSIMWSITDDRVTISVEDEGHGFNPDGLPDPTLEENLTRPHGRGVMLMNAYMTRVSFNRRGNRVTLVKDRECKLPHAD
jgi:serine/threonine-protein kinase RsbW